MGLRGRRWLVSLLYRKSVVAARALSHDALVNEECQRFRCISYYCPFRPIRLISIYISEDLVFLEYAQTSMSHLDKRACKWEYNKLKETFRTRAECV